jgi:hypothetical protein
MFEDVPQGRKVPPVSKGVLMANERLRRTIQAAGRDYQSVAECLGVDPKTVER